jgi:hypothetical protein
MELGLKIFKHLSHRCNSIRGHNDHIFNPTSFSKITKEASLIATSQDD